MLSGIFITGTDTGVGKTYVAAGFAAALRKRGKHPGVMKPVETGCRIRAGKLVPKDALRLMQASGVRDALGLVNPYRFRTSLAPFVAAEIEGGTIEPQKIIQAYRTLSRRHDFMIVEGAGGIMVPLSEKYLYRDLAREMNLPVVIVARPGLGTINHTLLTITALREQGVSIAGVVFNYTQDQHIGLAEETNPVIINTLAGINILGTVPYRAKGFDQLVDKLQEDDLWVDKAYRD